MSVDTFGIEEWQSEVKRIIEKYPEKGADFINYKCQVLQKKVKSKTPKGPTGKLRRSWRRTKAKEKNGTIQGDVKSSAPHAHLIEYGHVIKNQKGGPELGFVPGRHILQSSVDEMDAEFDNDAQAWLNKLVKEIEV